MKKYLQPAFIGAFVIFLNTFIFQFSGEVLSGQIENLIWPFLIIVCFFTSYFVTKYSNKRIGVLSVVAITFVDFLLNVFLDIVVVKDKEYLASTGMEISLEILFSLVFTAIFGYLGAALANRNAKKRQVQPTLENALKA